jgi:hypothetical protein
MLTPLEKIADQIQRMSLNEGDKQRWITELKGLERPRLEQLAELLKKYDEESLKVLNEKVEQEEAVKTQLHDRMQGLEPEKNEELGIDAMAEMIHGIFSDQKKLVQFLTQADDVLLVQVEKIFDATLVGNPERQKLFKDFFTEARLQRAALDKELRDQEGKLMDQAIATKQLQIKSLDAVMREMEKTVQEAEKDSK